jgi:hypothetical protein
VVTAGKVRCSPSSPCSRRRCALRVAAGSSAPPIPCVARRGHGGARSGRESRFIDRTRKLDLGSSDRRGSLGVERHRARRGPIPRLPGPAPWVGLARLLVECVSAGQ